MKTFRAILEAFLLWLVLFCAAMIPGVKYAPDSYVLGIAIGIATVWAGVAYFYWRTE